MSLVQASTVPSRMGLCHLCTVESSVESQESTVRTSRGFPKHTLEYGCSMESFDCRYRWFLFLSTHVVELLSSVNWKLPLED